MIKMPQISPQGRIGIGVSTALTILATAAVVLRFIARRMRVMKYEIDDWITLLALCFLYAMYVAWIVYAVDQYEGFHLDQLTPDKVILNFKGLFAAQLTYTFCLPTVKISILLFYRRIFVTKSFQIASLVLIYCCVAWFIAIFCLDIWQCTPIQRQWDRSIPGTCVNDRTSFVANGIFSIIIDFSTLLLPMPVIWKLNRAWQDRIGLMGIFALGGFVCATGIVRTVFISTYDETDATYTIAPGVTWSYCEPAIGLLCGSLPTMRVFLPRLARGSTKNTLSKPTYDSSQHTVDKAWPSKYQMMQGDEIPLASARTDNYVSAERGEANHVNMPSNKVLEDQAVMINVQKEIVVT